MKKNLWHLLSTESCFYIFSTLQARTGSAKAYFSSRGNWLSKHSINEKCDQLQNFLQKSKNGIRSCILSEIYTRERFVFGTDYLQSKFIRELKVDMEGIVLNNCYRIIVWGLLVSFYPFIKISSYHINYIIT